MKRHDEDFADGLMSRGNCHVEIVTWKLSSLNSTTNEKLTQMNCLISSGGKVLYIFDDPENN
jgi:hypothetical protein